jgi:hypothetical protein
MPNLSLPLCLNTQKMNAAIALAVGVGTGAGVVKVLFGLSESGMHE